MKSCGSAFRLLRANGLAGVRAPVCGVCRIRGRLGPGRGCLAVPSRSCAHNAHPLCWWFARLEGPV